MIVGIGVDSIEIERIKKACEDSHFVERIFTDKEREQMDGRWIRGASDYAGKEAVVKAFGTGFVGVEANEISILRNDKGAPYVVLHERAELLAKKLGISEIRISITNTREYATAFVIALAGEKNI